MSLNNLTKRVPRAPYEFERVGPLARLPGGHKPDFTLSVNRPPQQRSASSSNFSNSSKIKSKKSVTLDTIFIVDLLHTSNFEKCVEIDGSSQNLNAIDLTAIRQLSSVQKADFSDNSLPLEPFAVLPALQELDLSCNSLRSFDYMSSETMAGDDRAWASLTTLNLSFNNCSKILSDLQLIPLLADLNLANNSLSSLPSNLMHFTCLTDLNLSNNNLNTDAALFSLATIPSLRNLTLDGNNIMHIPKFQFGFEALTNLSIKNNRIEISSDLENLLDLNLEEVNIIDNPIVLRSQNLSEAKHKFAISNVQLICSAPPPAVNRALAGPLKTVALDPLTLPSFTKAHIRALNRKRITSSVIDRPTSKQSNLSLLQNSSQSPSKLQQKSRQKIVQPKVADPDDVFMTAFGSKADDDEPQQLDIEPTELPEPEEDEIEITSVWSDVPVVQLERRQKFTTKRRSEFLKAFSQLQFIVTHPDLRLKPRESPSMESEENDSQRDDSSRKSQADLIPQKKQIIAPKKKAVAAKLAARTEYTKAEIQNMLSSMQERLGNVEKDLLVADESGQSAVEMALDQKNFSNLHKQYELIRAELVNTLNS